MGLVSLSRDTFASRVDLMSNREILIFLVLLFQTSSSMDDVRKTGDISCDSVTSGNWRNRIFSGVRAGRIFWRVLTSTWPVPPL